MHHTNSPVSRLPFELLVEIFWLSIPTGIDSFLVHGPPWSLGHICSYWRYVSTASPRLWSRFTIDLERLMPHGLNGLSELTEEWLKRSANVPLTISFSHGGSLRIACTVLRILLRHITRWEHVTLHLVGALAGVLEKFQRGHDDMELPILKSLTYSCIDNKPVVNFFTRASQLRKVVHSVPCALNPAILPWSQLTHLACPVQSDYWRVNTTLPTTIYDILCACPSLVSCTADPTWGLNTGPSQASSTSAPTINRLIHLCLKELHISAPLHLEMSWFQLPGLDSLTLDLTNISHQSLLECIRQSQCTIRTLVLRGISGLEPCVFGEIIDLLPSMVSLEVTSQEQEVLDCIVQVLTIPSDHPLPSPSMSPAPQLRHLKIFFASNRAQYEFEALLDMAESRWYIPTPISDEGFNEGRCSRIESLSIKATRSANFPQLLRMQNMREDGLIFHASFWEEKDEDDDE